MSTVCAQHVNANASRSMRAKTDLSSPRERVRDENEGGKRVQLTLVVTVGFVYAVFWSTIKN